MKALLKFTVGLTILLGTSSLAQSSEIGAHKAITEVKNGQSVSDVETNLGSPLLSCKPKREKRGQPFNKDWADFFVKSERRIYLRQEKRVKRTPLSSLEFSYLVVTYYENKVISVTHDIFPYPKCGSDWT